MKKASHALWAPVLACLFALDASAWAGGTLGFSTRPSSPSREHRLRVRVFDDATRTPLSIELQVEPLTGSLGGSSSWGNAYVDVELGRGLDWRVTARHPGYASTSVLGVQPGELDLYLKKAPPPAAETPVQSGRMPRWQIGSNSYIYAGLVFKALSASDLLGFDSRTLVSPIKDTIDVLGPQQVPSNFVAPRQDVPILFGSVRLQKEVYRLPMAPSPSQRLVGIQGQALVSDLLGLIQGGGRPSVDLLNKLKFTRVGVSAPFALEPGQAPPTREVDASTPLQPLFNVVSQAPSFASDLFVVAATDLTTDRSELMPTDVKLARREEDGLAPAKRLSLAAPATPLEGTTSWILSVATVGQGKRLTGVLTQAQRGTNITPEPFLEVEQAQDFTSAPEQFELAPAGGRVGSTLRSLVLLGREHAPLAYVFVLPGTPAARVSRQALSGEAELEGFDRLTLEMETALLERAIDGTSAMAGLRRFTRARSVRAGTEF